MRWWRRYREDSTALVCSAVLFVSAALAFLPVRTADACPSQFWFGLTCPGCGLSRAFTAIARGAWAEAWSFHPWAYVLFPLAVLGASRPLWRRHSPRWFASDQAQRVRRYAVWMLLVLFAAWAVARALNSSG